MNKNQQFLSEGEYLKKVFVLYRSTEVLTWAVPIQL